METTMSIRGFDRRNPLVRGVATLLCTLLVGSGNPGLIAQTPSASPQATPAATGDYVKLTADQLVAPIALYPDPLLSQALVASTYPLELVQAQQWLAKNEKLKGDELTKAVEKQKWDPSVQATVVVPDLLKRLTEEITWTQNLGNAFLEQQDDVMNAVQRLRAKAKKDGKLDSTEQQKVETKTVESKTIIEIQPTSTTVVYVPTYSPTVIWGPMYYPYPPMYYPPYYPGGAWLGFGVGIAVGIGISGGWGWGCGWGGGGNNVYINHNNNFNRINTGNINTGNIGSGNRSNWQHNPSHRGNAPYASQNTANKFGGGGAASRPSTAGGANRPSTGSLSSGANRPSAGGTSASRPAGGDRAGSRSIPPSSSRSGGSMGGLSGGSSMGASRAGSASSRGGASMGGRARGRF
jgi:hypothetical protein